MVRRPAKGRELKTGQGGLVSLSGRLVAQEEDQKTVGIITNGFILPKADDDVLAFGIEIEGAASACATSPIAKVGTAGQVDKLNRADLVAFVNALDLQA